MGLRRLLAATVVAFAVLSANAWADALIYRCGPNICRTAPDGSSQRHLTTDGKPNGPLYAWVSASADGSRLGTVNATYSYVLNGKGRRITGKLERSGPAIIAEISPSGTHIATVDLVPEYLGQPPILHFQPYLFFAKADGSDRETTSRGPIDTGWLGSRLVRTDTADDPPFAEGICLLATNIDFECERDVARDLNHDLLNPAFSPDGTQVAVVQGPGAEPGAGPIVIYDVATARPLRQLVGGENTEPTWAPNGKLIAFERGGDIYVARATGAPREHRILKGGQQPTWTTAAACRKRVRLRPRRHTVIVTACAPQPGRLTVTLRSDGRRVARRTVQAPTGRLVKVRFHRPAGRLSAATRFRQLAATVR